MFQALLDMLQACGAGRVPGMVGPGAVWASVCDFLVGFVFAETAVGVVTATANSANWLSLAPGLVMTETMAPIAAHWFGSVGANVIGSPVAQGQMGRKRTSKGG